MNQVFVCNICSDRYNQQERKPLSLKCGHVICKECVRRMIEVSWEEKKEGVFACPQCKMTQESQLQDFVVCHAIVPFLDTTSSEPQLSKSESYGETKKNPNQFFCARHPKKIKYKCEPCQQFLCSKCILQHQGNSHEVEEFTVNQETVNEELGEVLKAFDSISHEIQKERTVYEKMEKKLGDLAQQQIANMNQNYEAALALLQSKRNKRKQEIQDFYQLQKGAIEMGKKGISKRLEQVKKDKTDFETVKTKLSEIPYEEFVEKMSRKRKDIKTVQSTQEPIHTVKAHLEDQIKIALYLDKTMVELGSVQTINYKEHKKDLKKPKDHLHNDEKQNIAGAALLQSKQNSRYQELNCLNSVQPTQNQLHKDLKLCDKTEQKLKAICKKEDFNPQNEPSHKTQKQESNENLRPNLCQTMMSSVTSNLFKQNINQYQKGVPQTKQANPYSSIKEQTREGTQQQQNKSSTRPQVNHHNSLFADYDKPQCLMKKQQDLVPALNLNKCTPADTSGSATHRDQLYENSRESQPLIGSKDCNYQMVDQEKKDMAKYLNPNSRGGEDSRSREIYNELTQSKNPFQENALSCNNITALPQTSKARQQNTRYQKQMENAKKQAIHNQSTNSDEEISTVINALGDSQNQRDQQQFVTQGGVQKRTQGTAKEKKTKKAIRTKGREESSKNRTRHKRGSSLQDENKVQMLS